MRLLKWSEGGGFSFAEYLDDTAPPYAVLSHTWGDDEITLEDIINGQGRDKAGFKKIQFCTEQSRRDGLEYFWVDTCCINKDSLTEMRESINSMFRWYRDAARCYVYLSDVSSRAPEVDTPQTWEGSFRLSRWFTRGWTLQELLAPASVEFFSREGSLLGSKISLVLLIQDITTIPADALRGVPLSDFSIQERMRWAAERVTTKSEDRAYCLLGIFDVSMPIIYGEGGGRAMIRLRAKINEKMSENRVEELLGLLGYQRMNFRQATIRSAQSETCAWLLKTQAYLRWIDPSKSDQHCAILWIKGKPGAGKSTLIKFLHDHACRKLPNDEEIIASYFFNAIGDKLERTTEGMYRSLLFQLVQKAGDRLHHMFDSIHPYDFRLPWTVEQLRELFTSIVRELGQWESGLRRIKCFIDALDECNDEEVHDMIVHFEELGQTSQGCFHVCLATRHYPTIVIRNGLQIVLDDEPGHAEDIARYVRKHLHIEKNFGEVKTHVQAKANGVFMWAVLTIDILNAEWRRGRNFALRKRLDEIPTGLVDLFRDILHRDGTHMDDLLLCIQWVLLAKRPLELKEFYFAMVTGSGRTLDTIGEWEPPPVSEDDMKRFVLDCSKGLVEPTRSKKSSKAGSGSVVQFIHDSVKDFLTIDGGLYELWPELQADFGGLSHRRLAACCERYLAVDLTGYIPSTLPKASSHDGKELRGTLQEKFPFLKYAAEQVFFHANEAAKGTDEDGFLTKFNLKNWILAANLVAQYEVNRHTEEVSLLYLLAERDCARLIEKFYELGLPVPQNSVSGQRYQCPFSVALAKKHWDAVQALLEPCRDAHMEEVVENLRKTINTPILQSTRAYVWALHNGHERFAEMLTSFAFTDTTITSEERRTALLEAAKKGFTGVVRYISQDRDADINNALFFASEGGRHEVVKLLLDNGADVNAQEGMIGNPLHAASVQGHKEVIKLLLAAGADDGALQDASARSCQGRMSLPGSSRVTTDLKSTLGGTLPTTNFTSLDTKSLSEKDPAGHEVEPEADQFSVAGTLNMGEESNAKLASLIASSLIDSLHKTNFARLGFSQHYKLSMQALLRSFAPMLCLPEHGSAGLESARFIWRHCQAIAQEYVDMTDDTAETERPLAGLQRDPELQPRQRTADWLGILPDSFADRNVDGFAYNAMLEDGVSSVASQGSVDTAFPQLAMIEQTVIRSDAWRWLISRIISTHQLTYWKSDVMELVCSSLPRLTRESGVIQQAATYKVSWDPVAFLDKNFPQPGTRLRDVITVTSSFGHFYACTCAEYLEMVWPSLATKFLDVLQMVVDDRSRVASTNIIEPGSTVIIHLEAAYIVVVVSGPFATVMEIGEQLAWLGASCSSSLYSGRTCKQMAKVTTLSTPLSGHISLQVDYNAENSDADNNHNCWEKLFRSVSVATDFPVPVRADNTPGLETTFETMVTLAETPWATVFNDKFMLKGFSSLMYPVKRATDHLIWHFVHALDWQYLPHVAGSASCLDRLALAGGDVSWLRGVRHFIAWTPDAETHTGTRNASYDITEPSPNACFSNISLEKITISASKYISLGGTVAPGRLNIPLWSAPFSEYLRDIVQASQEWVLLYDAEDERAWLVDAASALLHITVAQLRTGPEAKYWDKETMKRLKYPQPDGTYSCLDALLDKENRRLALILDDFGHERDTKRGDLEERTHIYRFQHLVHDNWRKLAQIIEQHALKPAAMELRLTTRDRLVGWSFRSLVNSKALLSPKIVHLASRGGWLPLVRNIDAAILIGHGFGDVIRPSHQVAQRLCRGWSTMPVKNEYMAVTTHVLRKIAESKGCRFPDLLAKDVWWVRWRNPFELCHHNHVRECAKCDFVQELSSSNGKSHESARITGPDCERAALIFAKGHDSRRSLRRSEKGSKKSRVTSPSRGVRTGTEYSSAVLPSLTSSATAGSSSSSEVPSGQNISSYPQLVTGPSSDKDKNIVIDHLKPPVFRSFVYPPDRPFHPAARAKSEASAGLLLNPGVEYAVTSISSTVHEINRQTLRSAETEEAAVKSLVQGTPRNRRIDGPQLRRKQRFPASFVRGGDFMTEEDERSELA